MWTKNVTIEFSQIFDDNQHYAILPNVRAI